MLQRFSCISFLFKPPCLKLDVRNFKIEKKQVALFLVKSILLKVVSYLDLMISVVFKSIASKYEDVVAMVPLTKMDSSILHTLFNDVMNAITTISCNAVVSLVDGHSSYIKFYKKELCSDKTIVSSFIFHSLDQHQLTPPL